MDDLSVEFTDRPEEADADCIHQQIKAFNDAVSPYHREARQTGVQKIAAFVRDFDGQLAGGLVAQIYWGWLYLDNLWLRAGLRGRGYGSRLMGIVENEAKTRGCTCAFVETFSFQARDFYEKHGFYIVGRLDDYPPGSTFYWMRKDFSGNSE